MCDTQERKHSTSPKEEKILRGREIAEKIFKSLKKEVEALDSRPVLADIVVGDDLPSQIYIKMKEKAASKIGIELKKFHFSKDINEETLIKHIKFLNSSSHVHGIVLERPLPSHLNYWKIVSEMSDKKDVEGVHPLNLGSLILGKERIPTATAVGVVTLLEELPLKLEGASITIINHSPIVGRPLAEMFLNRNATVSVCHIFTKNLTSFTKKSHIIVVGVGIPQFLKKDMVPEGCIVIDVGFNKREDGRVCGDADFEALKEKVRYITPVPGGVGPMTVAALMKNCLTLYKRQNEKM